VRIIIDYDNNTIRLIDDPVFPINIKVQRPGLVRDVLYELLNLLNHSGVSLERQIDGEISTIEEW